MIDVVVLCGGLGTRLKVVTGDQPKILAPINGRPFLDYLVDDFKAQQIKRLILCTGHGAKAIEDYCKKNVKGMDCVFSYEDEPLGTGGALKNAKKSILSNPFIVVNGDSFVKIDLKALKQFHDKHQALATLVAARVDDAADFGTIDIERNSMIRKFFEKDPTKKQGAVNAGIYCFDQKIFSKLPSPKKFSLEKDVFPELAGQDFYAYMIDENFLDIGTPERLKQAQKRFKK